MASRMATSMTNMSSSMLPNPSEGRLRIRNITIAVVAGSPPFTWDDFYLDFDFNPMEELSSPARALSFFSPILSASNYQAGREIADQIATFAFDQVSSRNWLNGLYLSVSLETIHEFEDWRSEDSGGHGISNEIPPPVPDALADPFYSADLDHPFFDVIIRPFGSIGADDIDRNDSKTLGMSEREISLLRIEEVTGNGKDERCCSICLEEFVRGEMITPLSPCSHTFHTACIVQWLQNKPTCPICRSTVTVS